MEANPKICAAQWSGGASVFTLKLHRCLFLQNSLCCRTCQHCSRFDGAERWCRMRRLAVPPEAADLAVCHHWTPRSPDLPRLHAVQVSSPDHQLELGRHLA